MEAYAVQINIYDDDGTELGRLRNDIDDIWLFDNVDSDPLHHKPNFITADEYRFIADVIESELCSKVIRDKEVDNES